MLIIGPEYLGKDVLPLASDILYHKNLCYTQPTGFHPTEFRSIIGFPMYCHTERIALPKLIWEMPELYFDVAKDALAAHRIIEPLRKYIKVILTSYSRETKAIDDCITLLNDNPNLAQAMMSAPFELKFATRELFSHLFFEVFLESGYQGVVERMRQFTQTTDTFFTLLSAVMLNRLCIISSFPHLILYNHGWIQVMREYQKIAPQESEAESDSDDDSFAVEHFRYKLFESLLSPILGHCDTYEKSCIVCNIVDRKAPDIEALKEQCQLIALEVVLLKTSDAFLKQKILSDRLNERILKPFASLIQKPEKDASEFLKNFLLNGGLITALLSISQPLDPNTLTLATTASAISAIARYIFQEADTSLTSPSKIILEGIDQMGGEYEKVLNQLMRITYDQLDSPFRK